MDFLELAKQRYSCRQFATKLVEREKIEKILEAGRLAPTAKNMQSQRVLILQNEEQLAELSQCTPFGWNAPVVMVICYDKDVSGKRKCDGHDYGIEDASIVTTHMILEVEELGLGATWVGHFEPDKVREIYKIPENFEIVALLPIGYPAEEAKPNPRHEERQEMDKWVYWDKI